VYPAVNLSDETANIAWPIPLDSADVEISDKDKANPRLGDVVPMQPKKTLIIGAKGQLGRALQADFPGADLVDLDELDVSDAAAVAAWPWHEYTLILNAAAYTAVDVAETPEGRITCWAANALAPAHLARVATEHRLTLVHVSSDYVFDGTAELHTEDEAFSPLGVYGQSKAAGDIAVATTPKHYILRTSWVIGDGNNFVKTMARLADNGVSPSVVDDQFGRLTFTSELSRATKHLIDSGAPFGTYNVTNSGDVQSWAEIARDVFELRGRTREDVSSTSTTAYAKDIEFFSPRPTHSALDLAKIEATGFVPSNAQTVLKEYAAALPSE
jgi:dTDP-4-dehydrorhamnose 3,5-epimerase